MGSASKLWLAGLPLLLSTASCVPPNIFAPKLAFDLGSVNDLSISMDGLPVAGSAVDCLASAVYYEARSESEAGQRAVAQVVLNRTRHPAFPATVCGVVFEGAWKRTGCQFSFTCDGSMNRPRDRRHWGEAKQIAREALEGRRFAEIGWATHYHTRDIQPYWAPTLTQVDRIGAHVFYRWNGRTGEARAFRQLPAPADVQL